MSKNLGIYAQEDYEENMNELRGVSDYEEDEGFRPERLAEDTEVENTIIETQDRLAEVEEGETNIELADQGIRSLESLTVTVEMLQANGGMNAQTAILYNHAYDSILRSNFGAKPSVEEYLSLEGFKSPSSRETSTTLALEDLKTKAKEIYKKAIEAIKKLIEQIKNAVKTFFSATASLKKRAYKMKEKIIKIGKENGQQLKLKEGKKAFFTEQNLASWGEKLGSCSDIGSSLKSQSITEAAKECLGFLRDLKQGSFLNDIDKNVKEMTSWAESVAKDVKNNKATLDHTTFKERGIAKLAKLFGRETNSDKVKKLFDKGDGGKYFHSDKLMPGGYALLGFMGHGGSGESGTDFVLPSISMRYAKVAAEGKLSLKDKDIPTDTKELSKASHCVADNMIEQENTVKAVEKTLETIKDNLDKLRSALSDADGAARGEEGGFASKFNSFKNKLFSYFKSLVTSLGSPINRAFSHNLSVNKLILSVVSTVLGNANLKKAESK